MHKPSLALALMSALLLFPIAGGAQPIDAERTVDAGSRFPASPGTSPANGYELAARNSLLVTTGSSSEIEAVRNEQPIFVERPEPRAPGQICKLGANGQRLSRLEAY